MTVTAVTMVRDEGDIIEASIRHMCGHVDRVIVADNLSSDDTRPILDRLAAELGVVVVDDPDPAYRQAQKMTALARRAVDEGAGWVVPFDADELWTPTRGGRLADLFADVGAACWVLDATLFDHVATADDDATIDDPTRRLVWRRPYEVPLRKVAVRAHGAIELEMGNHGVLLGGIRPAAETGAIKVHHFPYRSLEQFVRKVRNGAAAYVAAGDKVPADAGAHWRQWGAMDDGQLADIYRKWYYRERPKWPVVIDGERQPALVLDPVVRHDW